MRIRIQIVVLMFSVVILPLLTALFSVRAREVSTTLTLEEVQTKALEQNPELKALQEELVAAKTKISQARYWEDPEIGVRFYQIPFEGGFDETQDIDYIVRQKFPTSGKTKALSQMAYHEYQHQMHVLQGRTLEILRDLKVAYFGLFSVERMIEVSREIETNLRSMVRSAQNRVATDQAMASDAALGQTEIAKILSDRQSLFQKKQEFEAKLKQLMASPSLEEIQVSKKLEPPHWSADLEALMKVAEVSHPSLQSDKHHVEEKEWGVKTAKREYLPDLQVQAEYVQRPGDRVDAFTGEMMLNIPLIVGKKSRGVKEAEAQLASAEFMRQNTKNDIFYKIQEIYSKMKASEATLAINRGTYLQQARQAYQMTSSAYSTGKVGFVDMLSSLRMLFEAQMNYWKVFEEQAAAVFMLEEAVGVTREEFEKVNKAEGKTL